MDTTAVERHLKSHSLLVWVVYCNPSDYPNKYVVRVHQAMNDGTVEVSKNAWVRDSLAEVRSLVPWGLFCMPRDPNDDPSIVESWL